MSAHPLNISVSNNNNNSTPINKRSYHNLLNLSQATEITSQTEIQLNNLLPSSIYLPTKKMALAEPKSGYPCSPPSGHQFMTAQLATTQAGFLTQTIPPSLQPSAGVQSLNPMYHLQQTTSSNNPNVLIDSASLMNLSTAGQPFSGVVSSASESASTLTQLSPLYEVYTGATKIPTYSAPAGSTMNYQALSYLSPTPPINQTPSGSSSRATGVTATPPPANSHVLLPNQLIPIAPISTISASSGTNVAYTSPVLIGHNSSQGIQGAAAMSNIGSPTTSNPTGQQYFISPPQTPQQPVYFLMPSPTGQAVISGASSPPLGPVVPVGTAMPGNLAGITTASTGLQQQTGSTATPNIAAALTPAYPIGGPQTLNMSGIQPTLLAQIRQPYLQSGQQPIFSASGNEIASGTTTGSIMPVTAGIFPPVLAGGYAPGGSLIPTPMLSPGMLSGISLQAQITATAAQLGIPLPPPPPVPTNAYCITYTDDQGQLLDRLPVCRDFQSHSCNRPNCKYVHVLEQQVEVEDGKVTVCRDFVKGRCFRLGKCKYYHIPINVPGPGGGNIISSLLPPGLMPQQGILPHQAHYSGEAIAVGTPGGGGVAATQSRFQQQHKGAYISNRLSAQAAYGNVRQQQTFANYTGQNVVTGSNISAANVGGAIAAANEINLNAANAAAQSGGIIVPPSTVDGEGGAIGNGNTPANLQLTSSLNSTAQTESTSGYNESSANSSLIGSI